MFPNGEGRVPQDPPSLLAPLWFYGPPLGARDNNS